MPVAYCAPSPAPLVLASPSLTQGMQDDTADEAARPHIGIVGSGLAGLRCADVLLSYGFRVTIIEGRDRLGGRMHQEMLPNGHLVDIGPNWVHGTEENPMMDLATETGTATTSWDGKMVIVNEDGSIIDEKEGDEVSGLMWEIVQEAFRHSNRHGDATDPDESLLDFFAKRVVEKIPDTTEDYERKRANVLQNAETWGAFAGSPIHRQSLKFFWLEECIDGG